MRWQSIHSSVAKKMQLWRISFPSAALINSLLSSYTYSKFLKTTASWQSMCVITSLYSRTVGPDRWLNMLQEQPSRSRKVSWIWRQVPIRITNNRIRKYRLLTPKSKERARKRAEKSKIRFMDHLKNKWGKRSGISYSLKPTWLRFTNYKVRLSKKWSNFS